MSYNFISRQNGDYYDYYYDFGRVPETGLMEDAFISVTKLNNNGYDSHVSFSFDGAQLTLELSSIYEKNEILIDKDCLLYKPLLALTKQKFYSEHKSLARTAFNPTVRGTVKGTTFNAKVVGKRIKLSVINGSKITFNLERLFLDKSHIENVNARDDYKERLLYAFKESYNILSSEKKELEKEETYERN